ncbi:hypothetical protein ACO0QE_004677 [Hanseniaspora vineae]
MFKKRTVKKPQQKPSTTKIQKDSLSRATSQKRSLSSEDTEEIVSLQNDQEDSMRLLQPKKKLKLRHFDEVPAGEEKEEEKRQTISQRQLTETNLEEQVEDSKDKRSESSNESNSYHKVNVLMDYQPDVCKDYKLTGFCGYGDSCKFIHSRDDFIKGTRTNIDWKTGQPRSTQLQSKDIPSKCAICKKDYSKPIRTSCKHYFCQKCFLQRLEETPECFVCGKNTQGVMKPAGKLMKKK